VVAAVFATLYCVGRILYMLGYKTGVPDKRLNGSKLFAPAFLALLITNIKIVGVWVAGMI
jgi:hypothetical protein